MLFKIKQGFGVNNTLGMVVSSFNVMAHFGNINFAAKLRCLSYKAVVIFTDMEVVFGLKNPLIST
jgi:hypothetical protein